MSPMLLSRRSEETPRPRSLGMRLFRSKDKSRNGSIDSLSSLDSDSSSRRRLRKGSVPTSSTSTLSTPNSSATTVSTVPSRDLPSRNKLSKKQDNKYLAVDVSQAYKRDAQTGEQVTDHTDLLHSLVHSESSEDLSRLARQKTRDESLAVPGHVIVTALPLKIWQHVLDDLTLSDRVSLSCSCKAFRDQLGAHESVLNLPENRAQRTDFLLRLDKSLPNHIFCFACNAYHRRLQPGSEMVKPTNIANPIFICPHNFSPKTRPSRIRLTSGRTLSFPFVQLIFRHHRFGPLHGVSHDAFSRRWKDKDMVSEWTHQTSYAIISGHLLVRVTSSIFIPQGHLPPSALRRLLYNPSEEFHPYFSTCPHWRDGDLMPTVKCAISHVPLPITTSGISGASQKVHAHFHKPATSFVTLCADCRPMRRCPDCPTEYLVEIKMAEDRGEVDPRRRFKQALVVTRWSDLGDGSSPECPEWVACAGGVIGEALDSRYMNGMGRREIYDRDKEPDISSPRWGEMPATTTTTNSTTSSFIPSSNPFTRTKTIVDDLGNVTEVEVEVDAEINKTDENSPSQSLSQSRSRSRSQSQYQYQNQPPAPSNPYQDQLRQRQRQRDFEADQNDTFEEIPVWRGSGYDSIGALGRRALSGQFEGHFNVDTIPGQRIIDMNPRRERKGEAGNKWY